MDQVSLFQDGRIQYFRAGDQCCIIVLNELGHKTLLMIFYHFNHENTAHIKNTILL